MELLNIKSALQDREVNLSKPDTLNDAFKKNYKMGGTITFLTGHIKTAAPMQGG